MATSGDLHLATSGDFYMATDTVITCQSESAGVGRPARTALFRRGVRPFTNVGRGGHGHTHNPKIVGSNPTTGLQSPGQSVARSWLCCLSDQTSNGSSNEF